jgi:hypothetical protein
MRRALFHLIAGLVTAGAAVAAGGGLIVAAFATSVCKHEDRTSHLTSLRLTMIGVVVAFALAPALCAVVARRRDRAWLPYAAIATLAVVGVLVWALLVVDRVASFCM